MVGYLTLDEMVAMSVALNNSINTLKRLINQNDALSVFYARELETVQEAKTILSTILKRDN